jgi:hypothetical protein
MEWKSASRNEQGSLKIPKRWLHIHYYEALNILFRFENSVRVFVYAVLKNEFGDKWQDCNFTMPGGEAQSIKGIAARRIGQAETFGYLGFDIRAPMMHLTSGELIELLTSEAYWPKFRGYFRGDKLIIKNKLLEIGSIRNSLAHFRPIKAPDIEVIKQNSRHTLVGVEQCLMNMFSQRLRVPTNTTHDWYKAISVLGNEHITITPYFSSDESWLNLRLTFGKTVLQQQRHSETFLDYKLAKFKPADMLLRHPQLRRYVTYVTESVNHPSFLENYEVQIVKNVNLVFRKDVMTKDFKAISEALAEVLLGVNDECELLRQDNLARGEIVEVADGYSYFHQPEGKDGSWRHSYDELRQAYESKHPDEYWGEAMYSSDVVAARPSYPWMPEDISGVENIFGDDD